MRNRKLITINNRKEEKEKQIQLVANSLPEVWEDKKNSRLLRRSQDLVTGC